MRVRRLELRRHVAASRLGAHVRTVGMGLFTVGMMVALFVVAIGTVLGERRR